MRIQTARKLKDLNNVTLNQNASGPEIVYWVFEGVSPPQWVNMTVISPGLLDKEYPKTYGHYHPADSAAEIFKMLAGEGILVLQKKHVENGKWDPDIVDEVLLVRASAGDEVAISSEYGHSWSNISLEPLITLDNWNGSHSTQDYINITKHKGLAYYLLEDNGKPTPVPNLNYKELPKSTWLKARDFNNRK